MYKVVFDGQLVEGFSIGQVKKNIAKLFKLSDERAASIFGGQTVVLKRDADEETAKKYKLVLRKAGAVTRILPMQADQAKPAASAPVAATPKAAMAAKTRDKPTQDWSLSATDGEPLLREDERTQFVELDIDLGHISLVSSFLVDDPDEGKTEPPPPAVDTSHISVAEVGATIGDDSNATAPVVVADLDASIAPVGADLADAKPEPEIPNIDVSHIKLS